MVTISSLATTVQLQESGDELQWDRGKKCMFQKWLLGKISSALRYRWISNVWRCLRSLWNLWCNMVLHNSQENQLDYHSQDDIQMWILTLHDFAVCFFVKRDFLTRFTKNRCLLGWELQRSSIICKWGDTMRIMPDRQEEGPMNIHRLI